MAKTKYHFVCQSCGYTTSKWLGRCPECGAWDSFSEEAEVIAEYAMNFGLALSNECREEPPYDIVYDLESVLE